MMKKSSKIWTQYTVLLMALCFSTLVFAVAPIKVELEVGVVGGVTVLKVKENDKPCDGATTTSPCIVVEETTAPFIKFLLPDACKGVGDPIYELTGMRITQIAEVWPTAENPLNAVVAKDFKADPDSGEIDFNYGKNKKGSTRLKFKNRNSAEYTVFYEISASPCDDASDDPDIKLDPEIRNKGKF